MARATSLILIPILCACASDDTVDAAAEPVGDECGVFFKCDIREPDCQRVIFEATACVREQPAGVLPEVRTITRDEYRVHLTQSFEAEDVMSEPNLDRALSLLGLISPDVGLTDALIDEAVATVAAFYCVEEKTVSIIERADSQAITAENLLLVHEYTHVLQDRDLDLHDFFHTHGVSTDQVAAVSSLVEGDAELTSALMSARLTGRDPTKVRYDLIYEQYLTGVLALVGQSDSPLVVATRNLPYPVGAIRLTELWVEQGWGGVEALFDQPPNSLLHLMDPALLDEGAETGVDCLPPPAPEGFELLLHDSLGPGGVLALAVAAGRESREAWQEAHDWRGDRLAVYTPQGGGTDVLTLWRLRFSDGTAAQAIVDLVGDALSLMVQADADSATLVAADPADAMAGWDTTLCGAVEDFVDAPIDHAAHRDWSASPLAPFTALR